VYLRIEGRRVQADLLRVRTVGVEFKPSLEVLRSDLGMKLDAPDPILDPIALETHVAAGERGRVISQWHLIAVPLKRVETARERAEHRVTRGLRSQPDLVPADLRTQGTTRARASRLGDQLRTEADAEHRNALLQRARQEAPLHRDPGVLGVLHGVGRPSARQDRVVIRRVTWRSAILSGLPESLLSAVIADRFEEHTGPGVVLVNDREQAHRVAQCRTDGRPHSTTRPSTRLPRVNVLAIDQGTSATKALVVGAGGVVLGEGVAKVTPRFGVDGAVEQDPAQLLESVISAGRAALADAGGVSVEAVGLGNQGETVLRWDRSSGRALGPAISWQDRRAVSVTAALSEHAARLTEITGLPLDPYFVAPKIAWLARERGPIPRADGSVITTIDTWTTHQLTGAFVTDAATASRSLLLDLDGVSWSAEACEVFGIAIESLPDVVACDAAVGETDAFGPTLPVTGLIVDQQAALLAESCFSRGDGKCTYGTGAFILANTGTEAPRSRSGLAACVAWQLADTVSYCLDGQVYTAGAAVGWLERLGLIGDAADLDSLWRGSSHSGREPLAGQPSLPHGQGLGSEVQFIPGLAGLGAPFWAPDARGAWVGLSLATSREDLVSAVVWGIAAQVATLAQAISADLGEPLLRLRVDGGLTRSRALLQAQADLLQIPVEVYPAADATALGVAAVARLGAGGARSPEDAVGAWTPSQVVEPAMAAGNAGERLERFRGAAEMVAEMGAS
jgi:glycerol kinase